MNSNKKVQNYNLQILYGNFRHCSKMIPSTYFDDCHNTNLHPSRPQDNPCKNPDSKMYQINALQEENSGVRDDFQSKTERIERSSKWTKILLLNNI